MVGSCWTLKLAAVSVPPLVPELSLLLLPQPAATVTVAKAIAAIRTVSLDFIWCRSPSGFGYAADDI